MSDFLSHLVARSLDPAGAVRPRLASLFEPPGPSAGPAGGPVLVPEALGEPVISAEPVPDVRRGGESSTRRGTRPKDTPHPAGPPRGSRPEAGPVPAEPGPRPPSPAGPAVPATTRVVSESGPPPTRPQPAEPGQDSPAISPRLVARLPRAVEGRPPGTELSAASDLGSSARRDGMSLNGAGSSPESSQRRHDPVRPGFGRRDFPPAGPRSHPASVTAHLETMKPAAIRPRAEPEPVVQVTIGRIEVRAVPPAPASAKERPRSSVMSLDEYLRLRAKRGRE
jgi:hypothetical protein